MMQDHVTQDSSHGASAGDNAAKLARMASQIATFFQSYPDAEAVPAIADHINQFWSRRMREDFLGAVALNRLARFILDPRDQRSEKDYFDIVGTDEGIFGCMGLLACEDVCPKQIPLQEQLGKLRRKMALAAVKNILPRFLKKDF